ncbi:unnamed protein product, partial [Mesorhabditis spiculigera]
MPQYKLTYFDIRGLGEPARQLFALAHVEFEDNRIKKENWLELKPTTPFGKLPILEVDGKELAQSKAIYRYLGKQFGFAGADDWESAQIDQWADQLQDYGTAMRPWSAVAGGYTEGDKEKLYKEVAEPARDQHLPLIVKQLKANGSGFLVGSKVSWVDLAFLTTLEKTLTSAPNFLEKYPEITAYVKKIHEIPEIKESNDKQGLNY